MRRPAVIVVLCLVLLGASTAAPASAAPPKPSWAQPQIKAVVAAGLFAEAVPAFRPQQPLTQSVLAAALEVLALQRPSTFVFRVVSPDRAVTIRELDAALVGFLGLGDPARSVTAVLAAAGSTPKSGTGTETVARLLGLRLNHPAAEDSLELGPNDPATRAEAAYSLARVLELTSGWEEEQVRAATELSSSPSSRRSSVTSCAARSRSSASRTSGAARPSARSSRSASPRPAASTAPASSGGSSSSSRSPAPRRSPPCSAAARPSRCPARCRRAQRIRKVENLLPGDVIFQGDLGREVEARAGRPRRHLPGRRLVRPLLPLRHDAAPVRRLVPRPVRVGAAAAARGRPLLALNVSLSRRERLQHSADRRDNLGIPIEEDR